MLGRGFEKISTARGHNCTPLFALSHLGKRILCLSIAFSTADAFDIVCHLHRKTLLGLYSSRASRVLGPISRHRVADMKIVSRASRPGSLVDFLRILCNGLCNTEISH